MSNPLVVKLEELAKDFGDDVKVIPHELADETPEELHDFLLFGSGQHTCFGKHIVEALLPPLLRPLLRQENLRRAQGTAGTLQMNGVQAQSLTLEYKAG